LRHPGTRTLASVFQWCGDAGGRSARQRIKLHDRHATMAVVQTGSMTRAAALLNTTQPAISRCIAELEHIFGVRLLHRNPRGIEPAEYRRSLLDCGIAVFNDLRRGVKTIEALADSRLAKCGSGVTIFSRRAVGKPKTGTGRVGPHVHDPHHQTNQAASVE
jgi:hypothetical protein